MIRRMLARLFASIYTRIPLMRRQVLGLIARLEGGETVSLTARRLLWEQHGVSVGLHSYGSLLVPGMAAAGTSVGRYVSIGPNVRTFTTNHPMDTVSMHPYWYQSPMSKMTLQVDGAPKRTCRIESEAWVGANAVILAGCERIGIGAVIAAGAVVTRSVPDFAIFAGVPAKQIGIRLSESLRARALDLEPWNEEPDVAARLYAELALSNGEEDSHGKPGDGDQK